MKFITKFPKVFFVFIFLLICILVYLSNPLAKSELSIEQYVLEITPMGSNFDEVLSSIGNKNWKLNFSNESAGFYHQGIQPNRIVGEKSIRASLGSYQGVPFKTDVTVFWGFDNSGKMTDIWVWKTRNGI